MYTCTAFYGWDQAIELLEMCPPQVDVRRDEISDFSQDYNFLFSRFSTELFIYDRAAHLKSTVRPCHCSRADFNDPFTSENDIYPS